GCWIIDLSQGGGGPSDGDRGRPAPIGMSVALILCNETEGDASMRTTRRNEALSLEHLREKALQLRRNMLVQASGKGQGYLGQGLGIADFLAVLYYSELNFDPAKPHD